VQIIALTPSSVNPNPQAVRSNRLDLEPVTILIPGTPPGLGEPIPPRVNAVRTVRDPHTDRPPVREAEVEDRLDLSPDATIARISTIARDKARRDGGLAAPHAVAGLREAYQRLWDRYQELLCDTAPGHSFDCYFPDRVS
jgi:hypothetical protein